jgi:hypothetical protein
MVLFSEGKIGTGGGKRIYIETEVLMVHGTYLIF